MTSSWLHAVAPDLKSMLAYMRGRASMLRSAIPIGNETANPRTQAAMIRRIYG